MGARATDGNAGGALVSDIAKAAVGACPVCGARSRRLRMRVREHEYDTTTDDWFDLQECLECDAWYLDPRPHESALDVIYPSNYYAHSNAPRASTSLWGKLSERLFRGRMRPIERLVALGPETRWLEIGCGEGAIFESLHKLYGMRHFMGLDLSRAAVEVCRSKGYAAEATRFEDYELRAGERFDVVFSSHVIEHVASPREYLRKVYALLDPGGTCVFLTPNKTVWEARVFGRHWGGLHVPRHWALLDPASARRVAADTGFVHRATLFSANGVFWTWSFHSVVQARFGRRVADAFFPSDERINVSSPVNLMRTTMFSLLDIACIALLGQSSNMTVVLQKPSR